MAMKRDKIRGRVLTRRTILLGGGQLALVGTLAARMYYLQVVEGKRYTTMAEQNRINVRLVAPVRGRILDRFGVPLAINEQSYRVVLTAEEAGDIDSTLDAIAKLIPLGANDRRKAWRDIRRKHPFVPVVVRENLTWDEVSRIEVNIPELPGVQIDVGRLRHYPFAARAGHITGYVAPVAENELAGSDDPLLELPDFRIGKSGIEKEEDLDLRGSAGTTQIEVNALGRIVREISKDEGDPGKDIATTLDMALQDFTLRRIASEPSASCVVLDAITGEVLVMASSPGYDPNNFTQGLSSAVWQSLINDPHVPLNNKTIQGVYPPGSTFKPVVAMAALESGEITTETRFTCAGVLKFGNAEFHCWSKYGHGSLDLHGGLKNSCDIYFYEVAHRIGVDKIAAMANRLGIGVTTGIDVPNERPGLMPTREWKKKRYGKSWIDGETLPVGIGQGYVSATPLQLATMLARIVTNRAVVPKLVREAGVMDKNKPVAMSVKDTEFDELDLKDSHIAAVLSGMNAVTNEHGGTAYAARITEPGMEMGGKSGTAQVRRISLAEREHGMRKPDQIPWKDRDHALFIAFAPVGNPRYVCSVVVEHGIAGGKVAGPIARDVLRECQKRDPARQIPPDPMAIVDASSVLDGGVFGAHAHDHDAKPDAAQPAAAQPAAAQQQGSEDDSDDDASPDRNGGNASPAPPPSDTGAQDMNTAPDGGADADSD